MISILRKTESAEKFSHDQILIEGKDWDSLYASVHQLVEESRALRRKLDFYRQRYSNLVTKRQLAAGLRRESL